MRPGARVAGTSIDRVFTRPILPARRLHSALDAALAVALGSVCAFGLTLGPAPLNTVALSAPAMSSPGGTLGSEPGELLATDDPDDEVDNVDSGNDPAGTSFRPRLPAHSERTEPLPVAPPTVSVAPAKPNPRSSKPSVPPRTQPPQQQQPQTPPQLPSVAQPQDDNTAQPFSIQPTAVSVVEEYRIASGLGGFVAESACGQPVVHSVVDLPPSLVLPPGTAPATLARDPAFATASEGAGAVTVTIFRCQ